MSHIFNLFIALVLGLLSFVSADSTSNGGSLGCFTSVGGTYQGTYGYQSSGWCAQHCPGSPYVAIKNGNDCYCLDSLPTGPQTDTCNVVCSGWGSVDCGGTNAYSVFSGTGSVSSASGSSGASQVVSSSSPSSSSTSSSSTSTTSSSTTSSSSSTAPATTSAPKSNGGTTVITTSTNDGNSVIYKTVTQSSATASSSSSSTSKGSGSDQKKSSSNTGAIVGGVVGGLGGLAIIAAAAFFLIKRRNSDEEDDEEEFYDKPTGATLGRGNTAKGSKRVQSPLDMPMSNPFVHPSDNSVSTNSGISSNSLADPRLNPVMMGRRRLSEGSLADDADYSRHILQVANPDA